MPDYEAAIGRSIKGLKIGIPREYRIDGMPDEIEALWQKGIAWLKDAGAEIVDISLPHTKYALPAYYIVAPAEASSNLARYDGVRYGLRVPGKDIIDMYEKTRAAGFGREVKRRIMIGTYVLSAGYYDAYYLQAQKVRTLIKRDFEIVFADGVDVILTPATPSAAFGIADEDMAADPVKMYLNDIFTVTVNMAGLPGIAVPAGLDAQGPAARPAAHRQAVRRGDAVPGRRRSSSRRPAGSSRRSGGRVEPDLGAGGMFFYLSKIFWFFAQPLNLAHLPARWRLLLAMFGWRAWRRGGIVAVLILVAVVVDIARRA